MVHKGEEDCGLVRPVDDFTGVDCCLLDPINEEGKKNVTLPSTALKLVEEGLGAVVLVGGICAEGMDAMEHTEYHARDQSWGVCRTGRDLQV